MTAAAVPAALPFDDIRRLVATLPPADAEAEGRVRAREGQLVKPPGALGRLEEIAAWLAAWTGRAPAQITRPLLAVFASDHGIAARGTSAYPPALTRSVIDVMAAGGAAASVLAQEAGAGLKIYDLAVGMPTPDICEADALDERGCVATMAYGMEVLAEGTDLLVLGEVGIGNTAVAAALACALFGGDAADWTGPGTGVTGAAFDAKVAAVRQAVARIGGEADPLEILRRVGGREFAALAGAILAARLQRVPVILDGYAVCAAAAVLWKLNPQALDHCLAGHVSGEPGHRRLLAAIGQEPLLDLGMRLGEGTGGLLALQLVKAAAATHAGMATFEQAGIAV